MGMHMTGSSGILNVSSEHLPGLIALIVFPLFAWLAVSGIQAGSNRGNKVLAGLNRRLVATSFAARVALVAMVVGAVVHAAIVPSHWGDSRALAILFVADAAGFVAAAVWLLREGRFWRIGALAMLAGTVGGYVLYLLLGWEPADAVGLLTTGIELAAALVLVLPAGAADVPSSGRRWLALAVAPIVAVTVLGAADLAPVTTANAARATTTEQRNGMAPMTVRAGDAAVAKGTMAPMTGSAPSAGGGSMATMGGSATAGTPPSSMPPMTGSTPAPSGTMPVMPAATATTMPGMPVSSNPPGTSTTMPGMGGSSSGSNALSLATTSPAGAITWPLAMGAMEPGMQMVTPNCTTTPTTGQQAAAVALVDQTAGAVVPYQSLAVAKASGYVPITPSGLPVVHYAKPALINDGRTLDPNAIESLVYVNTTHGAVLVAAMYLMSANQVGATPPMPGGCLTEWHVHTNLCFSDSTGVVVGAVHGGVCPTGSANHMSQPMLHVWMAPVPGGPLTVDAPNAQVVQAAEALPAPNPPNQAA